MKKIITPLALLALPGASIAQSWQNFADFQDQSTDQWTMVPVAEGNRSMSINADPLEAGNYAFYLESGNYGGHWGDTFASIAIPEGSEIAPGETASIYCRYIAAGPSNSFHIAVTDMDVAYNDQGVPTAPGSYGHLSAYFAITNGDVTLRNGSGAVDSGVDITAIAWYELWLVINNTFDGEGNSTGTYRGYIKGPDDSEPRLLTFTGQDSNTFSDVVFRRAPVVEEDDPSNPGAKIKVPQALDTVVLATNSGNPNSPYQGNSWLVDDISIAAGDAFGGETWAGYTVMENGNANTGGWMGWVYTGSAPWIYNYTLEDWIWVVEPAPEDNGAWVYIMK